MHHIKALSGFTPEAPTEEFGDIGFVVDHEDAHTHDAASISTGRLGRGSRMMNSVGSRQPRYRPQSRRHAAG